MKLNITDIVTAVNGNICGLDNTLVINKVSTDSRTISKGDLFVAITGENFDGNTFASTALEKGAACAVVTAKGDLPEDKIILVEDATRALLNIAGLHRKSLPTKIVGITGSVGKTTTKEMTALVLRKGGKTFKTKANLNNEIGLAQMLLELDNSYKYAVLELGVDGPRQMLPMAMAAAPDAVVITNIGSSHLEAFKTRENIKKEKTEIIKGLSKDGALIVNGDDDLLSGDSINGEFPIFFGINNPSVDFKAENLVYKNNSTSFKLVVREKIYSVILPISGKHNVLDALAALAVGEFLGVSINKGIAALANYKPEGMRQQVRDIYGVTVVEDCYNASPQSMKAAIETLGRMETTGRKIAVFSDMLELGEDAKFYHREVGREIAENNINLLFTTGNLSLNMVELARESGYQGGKHFETKEELAEALRKEIKKGDIVWFKASRGMRLEEIIDKIF